MQIAVRETIVQIGRCHEEGIPIHAVLYQVVAEAADRSRWIHEQGYAEGRLGFDAEEGMTVFHRDERAQERAERLAERVRAHLEAGGKLDLENHWREIDPCYGSMAYQELDATGYFRGQEIRQAEDAGEIAPGTVH